MRNLSVAARAALDAVITAPGHLLELGLTPTPARWSDVGDVMLPDGRVFNGVQLKIGSLGFNGDAAPDGFSIEFGNLDSAIGALLLDNNLAGVTLDVYAFDRAAMELADLVPLGRYSITQTRVALDKAHLSCAPLFYTAPFRRVDAFNGFNYAIPEGTQVVWGTDRITLQRESAPYYG